MRNLGLTLISCLTAPYRNAWAVVRRTRTCSPCSFLMQSLEETERLVRLGMALGEPAAGGLRFGGVDDGFAANLDGILDEVRL